MDADVVARFKRQAPGGQAHQTGINRDLRHQSSVAGPVSRNRRHRIAGRQENTSRAMDAVFKSVFSEYLGLLSIGMKFA